MKIVILLFRERALLERRLARQNNRFRAPFPIATRSASRAPVYEDANSSTCATEVRP